MSSIADFPSVSTLPSTVPSTVPSTGVPKRDLKRCGLPDCKRKLMLTDLECKCGHRYCGLHRHAEEHKCTFDYKQHGLAHLSTTMVRCVASRLADAI
jgi:hypothetical protein